MRTFIYILFLLVGLCPGIHAQQPHPNLRIVRQEITLQDSVVLLSFEVETDRKISRKGSTVVCLPQITDGEHTVSFLPVVVQGRRSKIAWKRHAWADGSSGWYEECLSLRAGSRGRYQSEVPLQSWMHGASLVAEILVAGCCSASHDHLLMAPEVLPLPEMVGDVEPEAVAVTEPIAAVTGEDPLSEPTVADELAQVLNFVLPASEFDSENPLKIYDDERNNSLTIYFHINTYHIDLEYGDNDQALSNLLAAIDIIRESSDAHITGVLVGGFASPDGPYDRNDRLAWERAVSIKEYLMQKSGLPDNLILLYNGSADWQGLRLEVLKDRTMPGREQVLYLIDHTPVWEASTQTGRLTRIMQLQAGDVYRYMGRHIFPKLRTGGLIRVYYENNRSRTK